MTTTELERFRSTRIALYAAIAVSFVIVGCGSPYDDIANLDSRGSRIVCLGDSITRGHGSSPGRDYPSRLSELLGVPVVNAGRGGDTTGSALGR